METRVSLNGDSLRNVEPAAALAFVDEMLGASSEWATSLVAYRLDAPFQADWKLEVGCWLLVARELGFLSQLLGRVQRARNEAAAPEVSGPNDSAHLILVQELAPAMAVYFFVRTGWSFVEWEPSVPGGDVDVRLRSPNGALADLQVKASDKPGHVVDGQIVDGENDQHVLLGVDKAVRQLRQAPGPYRFVVASPQRTYSMASRVLVGHLVGKTTGSDHGVVLEADSRGTFATSARHVSGVVELGMARGETELLYRATVLLNPWAEAQATPAASEFVGARVLRFDGTSFAWVPEAPSDCSVPSGTALANR